MLRLSVLVLCESLRNHLAYCLNLVGCRCEVLLGLSHRHRVRLRLFARLRWHHVDLAARGRFSTRLCLHRLMEYVWHPTIVLLLECSHDAGHGDGRFRTFRVGIAFILHRDHTLHHRVACGIIWGLSSAARHEIADSLRAWTAIVRTLANRILTRSVTNALGELHIVKRLLTERVSD